MPPEDAGGLREVQALPAAPRQGPGARIGGDGATKAAAPPRLAAALPKVLTRRARAEADAEDRPSTDRPQTVSDPQERRPLTERTAPRSAGPQVQLGSAGRPWSRELKLTGRTRSSGSRGGECDKAAVIPSQPSLPSTAVSGLSALASTWSSARGKPWASELDSHLKLTANAKASTLSLSDLSRSQQLKVEFQDLSLNDYFDDRGTPRFKRLGLSFAAKQQNEIRDSFGSHAMGDSQPGYHRVFTAKQVALAKDALVKDAEYVKGRTQKLLAQVDRHDQLQTQDVMSRQLDMLFQEVNHYAEHLPSNVRREDLLPVEVTRDDEIWDRKVAEKVNKDLSDGAWTEGRKMGWLLKRSEVLQLIKAADLWCVACHGINCLNGMDRASFCRFILDIGLVDQESVPYYWAVALFDSVCRPARACPPDATWMCAAPPVTIVNRWTLMSLLDVLIRQRFTATTKTRLFARIASAVLLYLPDELAQEYNGGLGSPPKKAPDAAENRPTFSICALQHVSMLSSLGTGGNLANEALHQTGRVPAWLQPPERPASRVDLREELATRERLTSCMLVEPEVLHMATQYMPAFCKLHACYSDGDGHMDFVSLLQLCGDFCLFPKIATSDLLRRCYEGIKAVDVVWHKPVSRTPSRNPSKSPPLQSVSEEDAAAAAAPSEAAAGAEKRGSEKRGSGSEKRGSGEAARRQSVRPSGPSSPRGSGAAAKERRLSDGSAGRGSKRSSEVEDPEGEGASPRRGLLTARTRSLRDVVTGSKVAGLISEARKAKTKTRAQEKVKETAPLPSGSTGTVARVKFGPASLLETLFRVAIVYLGGYGNTVQKSSSPYARAVWLIAYLRSVCKRQRLAIEQRALETPPDGPFAQALKVLTLEAWSTANSGAQELGRTPTEQPTAGRAQSLPEAAGGAIPSKNGHGSAAQALAAAMNGRAYPPQMKATYLQPFPGMGSKKVLSRRSLETSARPPQLAAALAQPMLESPPAKNLTPDSPVSVAEAAPYWEESSDEDLHELEEEDQVTMALRSPNSLSRVGSAALGLRAGSAGHGQGAGPDEPRESVTQVCLGMLGSEETPFEEVLRRDAGRPCIVDRRCVLCKTAVSHGRWGNPRCRGCAAVDAVAFDQQPFRALLVDCFNGVKMEQPTAEMPLSLGHRPHGQPLLQPPLVESLRPEAHATCTRPTLKHLTDAAKAHRNAHAMAGADAVMALSSLTRSSRLHRTERAFGPGEHA